MAQVGFTSPPSTVQLMGGAGDVLELQRQLTASEAYNRFMDKRVKQLERELTLFKDAKSQVATRAAVSEPPPQASPAAKPPPHMMSTRPTNELQSRTAKELVAVRGEVERLVADNTLLTVEKKKLVDDKETLIAEKAELVRRAHAAEGQTAREAARARSLESELNDLIDILPPSLKEQVVQQRKVLSASASTQGDGPGDGGSALRERTASTLTGGRGVSIDASEPSASPTAAAGRRRANTVSAPPPQLASIPSVRFRGESFARQRNRDAAAAAAASSECGQSPDGSGSAGKPSPVRRDPNNFDDLLGDVFDSASESDGSANSLMGMVTGHSTNQEPGESSHREDGGERADGGEEDRAADGPAEEGSSSSSSEFEIHPLFDASAAPKERSKDVDLKLSGLSQLTARADNPPTVAVSLYLCDRTRSFIVDIRDLVNGVTSAAAALQMARRNALAGVVEIQASNRPSRALRSRLDTYRNEVETAKVNVSRVNQTVAAVLPMATGGFFAIATMIAGLAVRYPVAAGPATVRLLDRTALAVSRLALFDVNLVKPLLSCSRGMMVDSTIADMSVAAADDTLSEEVGNGRGEYPKVGIEQLKRMSNECRETTVPASAVANAVDMLQTALSLVADLRRIAATPRSSGVIPDADEVEEAAAEEAAGTEGDAPTRHHGPVTRSTQVNFYLHKDMPTAADAKLAKLAAVRQPWFECLKDVGPISPRRAAAAVAAAQQDAAAGGDGEDLEATVNEFADTWADEVVSGNLRSRGRDKRTLEEVLQQHLDAGLPVPSNFAKVRGCVYQFGAKRVQLHVLKGALTAKVGGGYVTFEEYCGMHFATEERRLRSPARCTPGRRRASVGTTSPRLRLPDTPIVQRARGRTPSRKDAKDAASRPRGVMDEQLREKLRSMGFNDEDFDVEDNEYTPSPV